MIRAIIAANPTICDNILQDLNNAKSEARRTGAKGMSASQVLRCLIIKALIGFTYEEVPFHRVDSNCQCWYCRIGMSEEGIKKSPP